ncbi:hypothetical protein SETIT_5G334200v2 [Setaria italica]|uniref:Uncharacterized protein n=2 Tax=Setaria italica TaxID=4555 RepID=A0A368RBU1_SETIT|nr:hypothetical protein SETIT_5G334200v2 [Setaria italica]
MCLSFDRPGVWKIVQVAGTNVNDDTHSAPLLQVRDHGVSAMRYQNWLVATVVHSLTAILYTFKEQLLAKVSDSTWTLLFRSLGPFIFLSVSLVLLIILARHYSISEAARIVIGSFCISYLLIVLTDSLCYKNTIILEIMLILLTVCMHTLRFVSQGASTKIEVIPLLVAILGVIPGISCIVTIRNELELLPPGIQHHAFKIATLLGAVFRFLDVIFMSCDPIRDMTNYFRRRLQECFI